MVESLDDALNSLIIEVARPLAGSLGEPEKATEWALRTSVIILAEAMQQRAADSEFFDKVLELVDDYRRTNADVAAEIYSSPASTEAGNRVVDDILGADRTNVTEEIAHAARLQRPAAACVLNVAAVLLLKSLEPEASLDKLDATPSRDRLSGETSGHSLPLPSTRGESTAAEPMDAAAPDRGKPRSSRLPWLLFAAATIATVGLAWRLSSDTHPNSQRAVAPVNEAFPSARDDAGAKLARDAPPGQAQEASPAPQKQPAPTELNEARIKSLEDVAETPKRETPSAPAKEPSSLGVKEAESIMKPAQNADDARRNFIQKKLPDGVELSIPESGVENKLLGFLEQASNKSGEFDLDRISFDPDKTALQSSSHEQLQNLAKMLKAYPNAKIAINSYTDNLGNKAHNLKLSRQRANNVLRDLARMGVDKSRMTARGFGDAHRIASNNSEEGRMQNRRISFNVTKK